jgi:DNA-binding response OmpR family regulator
MSQNRAPRRKILIIDDESHIVHVLSLKLRNAGYDVLCALDGEEGYALALEHRPDLIITDHQMPGMLGMDMCKRLSGDDSTASIPIIILTGRGYSLSADDLALPTIRDVVSKPFSPRAIVDRIGIILDGQGAFSIQP